MFSTSEGNDCTHGSWELKELSSMVASVNIQVSVFVEDTGQHHQNITLV